MAAIAPPAFAADLPVAGPPQAPAYVPAAPPVYDWGGLYFGVNAGGAWFDQGNTTNTYTGPFPTATGVSISNTGFAGGGQIGFNFQAGSWVFGLEGDADYMSNSTTFSGTDPAGGAETHQYKLDLLSTVRGRLGFAVDRTLFYGTGGLAMANYSVERTQVTAGLASAGTPETESAMRIGWVAGAGIEYAFTDYLTARAEYLIAGLESDSVTFPMAGVTQTAPTAYVNMVRAGLNLKIGGF